MNVPTSGAGYVAGDVVGGILEAADVVALGGRSFTLHSVDISDGNGNAAILNVYFLHDQPTGGTYADNGALTWGSADTQAKSLALQILSTDWVTDGGQAVVHYTDLNASLVLPGTYLISASGSS